MKILTANQIKQADNYTIENEPISSTDLMERAATKCFNWFKQEFDKKQHFIIFCGIGNNGGDGLALARMLYKNNYKVLVYEISFSKNHSKDYATNKQRLTVLGVEINTVTLVRDIPKIPKNAVIIDAIFGIGLSRTVNRFLQRVFYIINQSKNLVVSIDMPSGLFAENNSKNNLENIVFADFTLTFQMPKLSYFFPETNHFFGKLEILDITLHPQFLEKVNAQFQVIRKPNVQAIYKKRSRFTHKGTMGRALLIAGSYGKMGACILSAKACKKAGVGLLTVHVPKCGYEILQTSVPEAMALVDVNEVCFSEGLVTNAYSVVAIGPGLGIKKASRKALSFLISQTNCPMVIDADALNILSKQQELWKKVPPNSVITPHRGEWERICEVETNDAFGQLEAAQQFAQKHKIVVVLKDAFTAVIDTKGIVHFNITGNTGLATGGSGDVLTGIITALISQGYDTLSAAKLGVYLHGKAADIAILENESVESLIASDVINFLGKAFKFVSE